MTDKKFTDEEIIRNYEWCIGCTSDRCRECTMDEEGFCEEELQDLVLDLINRQKAEIERLKSMNQAKLDCIHDLQSENEELTYEVDSLKKQMEWLTGYNQNLMSANTALSEEIFIAKAEAYKEFANKVKQEFMPYDLGAFSAVRAVLKDLTGEDTNDLQIL